MNKGLVTAALLLSVWSSGSLADDTEIYFTDLPQDMGIANVLFILDHSGSMAKAPDGEEVTKGGSRYDIMRSVFDHVLADLPKNISAGVMHYGGHAVPAQANGIKYPVDVLSDDQREGIASTLNGVTPSGYTPLVQSLFEAALYFRGEHALYGNSLNSVQQAHEGSLAGGYVAEVTDPDPDPVTLQCTEGTGCDSLGVEVSNCRDIPATPATTTTGNGDQCTGGVDEAGVCQGWNQVTIEIPATPARRVCDYQVPGVVTTVPDYTYQSPIKGECQANYIVLLSDGEPDDGLAGSDEEVRQNVARMTRQACTGGGDGACGRELTEFLASSDQSPLDETQTVNTFTIGFANTGDGNQYLESIANLGEDDTQAFYTADSEIELLRAFTEIIDNIAGQTSSLLPPTLSLDNAGGTDLSVYVPLFRPSFLPRWAGNVKRYELSEANVLAAEPVDVWSGDNSDSVRDGGAASLLGTSRTLFTNNASGTGLEVLGLTSLTAEAMELPAELTEEREDIVRFAQGLERDGTTVREAMGDILHSRPLLVAYGDKGVVFVGTNEGYLHGFDADSGKELFGFMPRALLPNLPRLYENDPEHSHLYGMDGQLTVGRRDNGDTYLFAGMRRGGNNYYALDVTNPTAPALKWVIEGGKGNFALLGQTWSKPVLTQVELKRGAEPRSVLIFGGGYDPKQDDEICADEDLDLAVCPRDQKERIAPHARQPDDVGTKIFMVDAETGNLLWSAGASGSDVNIPSMRNALAATPAVIDLDGNGVADRIYAADLGGRIFRIDLPDSGNSLMDDSVSFERPEGSLFADLNNGSVQGNRRFFSEPDIALVSEGLKKYLTVSLGSGYRSHPLDAGDVEDRLYVLRDYDVYGLPEGEVLTDSSLSDASRGSLAQVGGGWYISLDQGSGEKALARAQTIDGAVFFTTFTPTQPPDDIVCEPVAHKASVYSLDLSNAGLPVTYKDDEEGRSRIFTFDTWDIPPEVSLLVAPKASGEIVVDTFVGSRFQDTSENGGGTMQLQGVSKVYWEED